MNDSASTDDVVDNSVQTDDIVMYHAMSVTTGTPLELVNEDIRSQAMIRGLLADLVNMRHAS